MGQGFEHHLFVVSAKDEVEARGWIGTRNPVLCRERVRSAVDEVPEAEHPVVLADLQLRERPAEGLEVAVHVADDEVPALVVALEVG